VEPQPPFRNGKHLAMESIPLPFFSPSGQRWSSRRLGKSSIPESRPVVGTAFRGRMHAMHSGVMQIDTDS